MKYLQLIEKKLPLIYDSKLEDVTDSGVKFIDSKREDYSEKNIRKRI